MVTQCPTVPKSKSRYLMILRLGVPDDWDKTYFYLDANSFEEAQEEADRIADSVESAVNKAWGFHNLEDDSIPETFMNMELMPIN